MLGQQLPKFALDGGDRKHFSHKINCRGIGRLNFRIHQVTKIQTELWYLKCNSGLSFLLLGSLKFRGSSAENNARVEPTQRIKAWHAWQTLRINGLNHFLLWKTDARIAAGIHGGKKMHKGGPKSETWRTMGVWSNLSAISNNQISSSNNHLIIRFQISANFIFRSNFYTYMLTNLLSDTILSYKILHIPASTYYLFFELLLILGYSGYSIYYQILHLHVHIRTYIYI